MIECRSTGRADTEAIAEAVATLVRPKDMIVLAGEMGAGKTAFTVGLTRALGVDESDAVSSPTFALVHSYATGRIPIVHADLYRTNSTGEVVDLGLGEQADMGAVVVVEWGDVVDGLLGDCLTVRLSHHDDDLDGNDDLRDIEISVTGHRWDARWERLSHALSRWSVR